MSGYFQDSVWDRIVLQLSHSEPAVRHAVNALGALHEERFIRGKLLEGSPEASLLEQNKFPTQQYAKALNEMQALLQDKNVALDTILLCSLLCIHFESLRECFVPALMHCEKAISLLHAQYSKFDARKVNPSLVRAMMRLDLQGTMYLGMRVPGLTFYTAATDSVLPTAFHDLTQARDLINYWTCRLYHFMRTVADVYKFRDPGEVPLEEYAKAQELEQTMLGLEKLLWDYMHKPTVKMSMREQHGLGMLRSRCKINRILAAGCMYTEACVYDRFVPEFQDILTNCLYIMASDQPDRRLFSVSLDEGLVHPLFFTATHCRDSRIRHQALEQLKKLPTYDGIWHIDITIRTIELCINFEESRCEIESPRCEDIPEFWRVQSASMDSWETEGSTRRVWIHFRTRQNGMDGEWEEHTEMIDW